MEYVLISTSLVTGVVGGIFLAFSDFIMPGFGKASPEAGREAMQVINTQVYRSLFLVMLMGLGPVVFALGVWAVWAGSVIVLAGAALYLFAVLGVTMVGNVPMNKRLDRGPDAAPYWPQYQRAWTRLNHLRSLGSVVAAACFAFGALGLG